MTNSQHLTGERERSAVKGRETRMVDRTRENFSNVEKWKK